jgi:rhamnosyltransferase
MSDSPDVSIFIPVKNGGDILSSVLGSVFSQETTLGFEVVVIDSGSTDGTLDVLGKYPVRVYEIPPEEFNHGLTRNKGMALCRGAYVVLLVQDAVPRGVNWLDTMVKNFDDPAVAGVYCRQIPWDHHDVLIKRQIGFWTGPDKKKEIKCIDDMSVFENLSPWEQFSLCAFDNVCSCIRKEVWTEYPFEETEFGEDMIWSKTVLQSGFKIVYEPDAEVTHSHDRSAWYEYKRTYICHRKLNMLFGLTTVPTRTLVVRSFLSGMKMYTKYVWENDPQLVRKLRTIARVPLLMLLLPYAQYKAARDQRRTMNAGRT